MHGGRRRLSNGTGAVESQELDAMTGGSAGDRLVGYPPAGSTCRGIVTVEETDTSRSPVWLANGAAPWTRHR